MPSIGFIGSGKVGTALGYYFQKKGLNVSGYSSRSFQSAIQSAQKTKTKAFENNSALIHSSDIIWITTNDDSIEKVVADITEEANHQELPKLFLHASGTLTIDILSPLATKGHRIATAHPLLAFGDLTDSVEQLEKTYFCIEKETPLLLQLLKKAGNPYLQISASKKGLYHIASVVLSNYLVTLSYISKQLYQQTGMSRQEIQKATTPLVESVLKNIAQQSEKEALTGPIKRGDANTILRHLHTIQEESPNFLYFYKTMGEETMKMLDDFKLKKIFNV